MVVSRGALALALACALAALAPLVASAAPPAIVVDPGQVQRTINPLLYGFDWESGSESQASDPARGAFNPIANAVNPNLAGNVAATGTTIIRFPGGTLSNEYDWRRAIGPQAGRGCQYRTYFSTPSSSVYGPDEAGAFTSSIGAELNIVVNANSLTPQEAGDWVEYMNAPVGANPNGGRDWAQVRASNGHAAPYGVRYWEVSNEMNSNASWLDGLTAAERTNGYANGGTNDFVGQRVGKQCRRDAADSRGDGTANQQFYAYRPPVVPASVMLTVGGATWRRVADLSTAAAADTVYTVDATTGRITFGDGVRGAIPASGAEIRVGYTSGPHAGFSAFYDAIKQVDPTAKACWGTNSADYAAAGANPLDCVQYHSYTGGPPRRYTDPTEAHDWVMYQSDQVGARTARQQRNLKSARPNADLAVTEYGVFPGWGGPTPTYMRSLDVGLFTANTLLDFARAGIPLAQQQQLTSFDPRNLPTGILPAPEQRNMSTFGYYPDFFPQASAHVIATFRRMLGDRLVSSTVVNNPTRTPAAPDLNPYAALNVAATTAADGRVTILVVNRDPSSDITASMLPRRFTYTGTAEVWTVNGTSTTASNEPGASNEVTLAKTTVAVAAGSFTRTFPAHSVTAIRLSPPASPPAAPQTSAALSSTSAVVAHGGRASTGVTLTNAGGASVSGTTEVIAPDGWTASVTPASYSLAAGGSTSGTLSVTVPADARGGSHAVAVVVRQGGQVSDVKVFTVTVELQLPGVWRSVYDDDFESDAVGAAPASLSVTGPAGSMTVQSATGVGKVLVVRRAVSGSTLIAGTGALGALSGDVRLSADVRADQATAGMGIQLTDGGGDPVAACTPASTGQWACMDGSTSNFTFFGSYTARTWQRVDIVLRVATGRYEVYLDGTRAGDVARVSAGAPSELLIRIPTTNTGVSSYAIDDLSVETNGWPTVYSDDFESDAVGAAPASLSVTGPSGSMTVQNATGVGKVLVVRRAVSGSTLIAGTRSFAALSGDVRLSTRVRADQATAGMGIQLTDGGGNAIAACTPAASGQWSCMDGTTSRFTSLGSYAVGAWQQLDIVLRVATGRYEVYLDGVRARDLARVSANQPSQLLVRIPTTNTGVSSYALDDLSVARG